MKDSIVQTLLKEIQVGTLISYDMGGSFDVGIVLSIREIGGITWFGIYFMNLGQTESLYADPNMEIMSK